MEYMSQEGYDKLVAELHQMESVELPQVREAIAAVSSVGENPLQAACAGECTRH